MMNIESNNRPRLPRTQQGAALIVALVLLLIMTLIAVGASRTSVLQERMAGNLRQGTVAFEGAEATLRLGEEWVEDQVGGARPVAVSLASCASAPCDVLILGSLAPIADSTWTGANSGEVRTAVGELKSLDNDPQYFIEQQQVVPDSLTTGTSTDTSARIYYRVTSRAVNDTTTAESILRSVYAVRF